MDLLNQITATELQQKLIKTGDTMKGILDMGNDRITDVADPTAAQDAATENYFDTLGALEALKLAKQEIL